jgi:adenylate cyclase class IV
MIEVELKARLRDRAAVEARVASFAVLEGGVDKLDSYWHGPDWRLHRGTKGFRVRVEAGTTVATFKNKRSEGGIEINREREFSVSDPEAFLEFVLRLGCEPFYKKRKRGNRYRVDPCSGGEGARPPSSCEGSATIEIIEVEGLGDFIEIEVLLLEEEPAAIALAQGEIRGLLARSGVDESAIEPKFYSELLIETGLVPRP